jgi:DNA-binding NtrC family response regulator
MASTAMKRLDATIRAVAGKEVAVTLIGESGSGKEILARRLHGISTRRAGPFVPINCAAIPDALVESELFGHEKGAFTGASDRVLGKIEAASGGTLFLDEIGEMPLGMQAKLLRFLENHRFMRVGGNRKIEADVRLLCATLRPLEDDVRAGRFRPDLYYRIQGVTLRVPPLRERQADVRPLVTEFVSELSSRHAVSAPRFTRAALAALCRHDWPGNVRELRNVVELMCLLHPGRSIRPRDLPDAVRRDPGGAGTTHVEVPVDRTLDEILAHVITVVLARENGNRTRTAARLGIGLRTLQRHLAGRRRKSGASAASDRTPGRYQA